MYYGEIVKAYIKEWGVGDWEYLIMNWELRIENWLG
jgi:hypothetical protein